MRDLRLWNGLSGSIVSLACLIAAGNSELSAEDQGPAKSRPAISGEELFRREWIVDDPRSHGGDGLGPVFNDTSCIACHNQGGAGGAGPSAKNVDLLSAVGVGAVQNFPFFERVAPTYVRDRREAGHVLREFELTFSINLISPAGG